MWNRNEKAGPQLGGLEAAGAPIGGNCAQFREENTYFPDEQGMPVPCEQYFVEIPDTVECWFW
jgi:hypothetical protein